MLPMKSFLLLSKLQARPLPLELQDDDIRYSDDLAERMVAG